MKSFPFSLRNTILLITLIGIVVCWLMINQIRSNAGVLAEDVVVTASVPVCNLQLTARPADRIPPIGNWGTYLNVNVTNLSDQQQFAFAGNSDNQGTINYDLCDNSVSVVPGTYNFYIRGLSHLRKRFPAVQTFTNYNSSVIFAAPSQYLVAGETSEVYDNFINGLDISTQVVSLYTGDEQDDLNQDGVVNALDLSITVKNLYVQGD